MKRILVVFSLACLVAGPVCAQTLRIYQIDVEQADAALFVMPNGKTLLIDSGKNGMGPRIKTVMAAAGVSQIDVFVNSHYHEDHFGGIDDLVDMGVSVLESFDRGDKQCCVPAAKRNEATFKSYLRTVGEDAKALRRGGTIDLDPLVTITAISSGGVVVGEANPTTGVDENDLSVSVLIDFLGFKAFYGGDIEQPTEAKIAALHLVRNIDLYKADHHGSDTSSSLAFMNDMRPSVIVISNGSNATYKHPRRTSLNGYATLPGTPAVFQTNKCLQPAPCANVPNAQIGDPETTDEDGTIEIDVNGGAGTYTLRYGQQPVRTFRVKAPQAAPSAVTAGRVVIERLLPNPAGNDELLEEVTLRNKGAVAVSLVGWTLQDRSGDTWELTGSIAPNQSRTFVRNGQTMSLNNAGDDILLRDAVHMEQDRFTYTTTAGEGMQILTQH